MCALSSPALSLPAAVLGPHWLGHRRVTRRVLAAFPADALFTYRPAAPLRSFGEMAWELHGQTAYTLRGLLDGAWGEPTWDALPGTDPAALLAAWDEQTARIAAGLPDVPAEHYGDTLALAWGEMTAFSAVIGAIDHEIHHRAQGMVYLRELGHAPPDFWERA